MNSDLRTRSILIGLLLIAWAGLVYAKTVLLPSVLPDVNALINYIQVLLGGIVGYHVGAPASPVSAPPPPAASGKDASGVKP
jgi:hypothetical protein